MRPLAGVLAETYRLNLLFKASCLAGPFLPSANHTAANLRTSGKFPLCGRWIDMRDLGDVLAHERACDRTAAELKSVDR
jgi:hypothetical protein